VRTGVSAGARGAVINRQGGGGPRPEFPRRWGRLGVGRTALAVPVRRLDAEADLLRNPRKGTLNVAGADDEELGLTLDSLDMTSIVRRDQPVSWASRRPLVVHRSCPGRAGSDRLAPLWPNASSPVAPPPIVPRIRPSPNTRICADAPGRRRPGGQTMVTSAVGGAVAALRSRFIHGRQRTSRFMLERLYGGMTGWMGGKGRDFERPERRLGRSRPASLSPPLLPGAASQDLVPASVPLMNSPRITFGGSVGRREAWPRCGIECPSRRCIPVRHLRTATLAPAAQMGRG